MKIAFFPYGKKEENPYQKLLKEAVELNEKECMIVLKWHSKKWFPYLKYFFHKADIIHHFWPHDFYLGKNQFSTLLKWFSFQISLFFLTKKTLIYSVDNLVSHSCKNFEYETNQIQKLIKRANGLIFTSNESKNIFQSHYKIKKDCKILILPHVSYIDHYKNDIGRLESRQLLNINPKDQVLLSLGRVDEYKGILELIDAFIAVANDNCVLVIAGKCSDKKYEFKLKTKIKKAEQHNQKIIFQNDYIPDDDLQIYYNASDSVILNYKDAPMNPGSLIMAMGFECCIIAPNYGALPEIVPTESFIGYDRDDTQSLKNAIKTFLSSEDIKSKAKIAKEHVLRNHSQKIINEKLNNFYRSFKK